MGKAKAMSDGTFDIPMLSFVDDEWNRPLRFDRRCIPMGECFDRGLYRLSSRNLKVGVFDAVNKSFVGIRHKFDSAFLSIEYHFDCGAPFGTARPLEPLDVSVAEDVPISARVPLCSTCGEPVTEYVKPDRSYWSHERCPARGKEHGIFDVEYVTNHRLFNLLLAFNR